MSSRRLTFLLVPAASLMVMVTAAAQHIWVLRVDMQPRMFVIPGLVGAFFGYLIARIVRLREKQRKQLQALEDSQRKIEKLNRDLTHLLEEKRAALSQTEVRLEQAQRLDILGRFAGGVAHDFNNLLTAIIGGVEVTIANSTDSEQVALLQSVMRAALQGADLTRQLLDFARPKEADPEVIDLNRTVGDAIPMLRLALGTTSNVAWKPGEDVPPAYLDEGQLGQVLMNLVVNARDAMAGPGTIEVSTEGIERSNRRWARLVVKDSGIGMDAETRARVLEPFFSTKPSGRGTGLGLAVTYGIVNKAGGKIEIESEVGVGTKMIVEFPQTTRPCTTTTPPRGESTTSGMRGTVLIVEDEEAVLRTVARTLSGAGHTVLPASDSQSAQQALAEHPGAINLILCDVALAGESGVDVARELLALRPGTPLIFMTGYADEDLNNQALTPEPILRKPFGVALLLERVDHVLTAQINIASG